MTQPREKLVRFQDWRSDVSFNEHSRLQISKLRSTVYSVSENFHRGLESGSEKIKRFAGSFALKKPRVVDDGESESDSEKRNVLDPQGSFLQKWNRVFVLSCMVAVSLDPLFFYIPVINDVKKCLDLDRRLEMAASVLRSFTDVFYLTHIIFQFRTGFIAPSSRLFGRGVLVQDSWAIAKRYLSSYFIIDVLAVLPLPQIAILIVVPVLKGARSLNTMNLLKFVVIFQYIPRILRVYPLCREVTRTSGILTETAWAGAAFNLFLYMLASHVLGAFWYLFSIERETVCWEKACGTLSLYCGDDNTRFIQTLNNSCPIQNANSTMFDFGMFLGALQSGVVESNDFPQKLFFCFWWGLQNLSSLGQNLKTSTFVWEICFAVFISISGLVLFSFLIGNMQTYLQSTTMRLEEMRVKKRDAEQWMSHRLLPDSIKERIRRYEQYKWQETRGVCEESLVQNLPKDLRRDIKRHLCLALLTRVPMFEKMDDQLLDAMCECLKPALYTEDSHIVREGDPVDEMLFIMRGKLVTVTTNGGRTGFFNSDLLKAGDFCGEELLTWALDPHSSSNLPISTRTVEALSEVEAFALVADDLKFVASQFRRLHSKQVRNTFRYYSPQWRSWAACFVQAAWRRCCRKKMEECLREEEGGSGGRLPSLGAAVYASRFAANVLRALRRNGTRRTRVLLQKPAEPDFTDQDN